VVEKFTDSLPNDVGDLSTAVSDEWPVLYAD